MLPLRLLNLTMVHANTTMQLQPNPLKVNRCGSAMEAFQGLLATAFPFKSFLVEQEELLKGKKNAPLVLPNLAETGIVCTVRAAGQLIQL